MMYVLSFILFSLGIPSFSPEVSLIASFFAPAAFFLAILKEENKKTRFWKGTFFGFGLQLVYLFWVVSHPFWYIIPFYVLFSFILGTLLGLLSIFCDKDHFLEAPLKNALCMASLWTLLEWSRLFWLSGFSFNPLGLSLSASIYSLQWASIFGVFGLSFWMLLTNAYLTSVILRKKGYFRWSLLAIVPFVFGFVQINIHQKALQESQKARIILVQPNFPVIEEHPPGTYEEAVTNALEKWRILLSLTQNFEGKKVDLVVFPEGVLPLGVYTPLYTLEEVKDLFKKYSGNLPQHTVFFEDSPWAKKVLDSDEAWVGNGFIFQTLSSLIGAPVIAGLEEVVWETHEKKHYTSCFCFEGISRRRDCMRYDKRVLVPLGEYIPFDFLKNIAKHYGVTGSFVHGSGPLVFDLPWVRLGPSICYEETFGHLMKHGRSEGANLYVNITNDAWYPKSSLAQQHLDHARLRTVENGVPLVRSCNSGISAAFDALGNPLGALKDDREGRLCRSSLDVEVPLYTFGTPYTFWGDWAIVSLSLFCLVFIRPTRSPCEKKIK